MEDTPSSLQAKPEPLLWCGVDAAGDSVGWAVPSLWHRCLPKQLAWLSHSWGGTGAWWGVCPGRGLAPVLPRHGVVPSFPWPPCHPARSTESSLCRRGVARRVKQKSCKHLLSPQLLSICCSRNRKGEFFFFWGCCRAWRGMSVRKLGRQGPAGGRCCHVNHP